MQVSATLKYARISAQKCRLVADAIRGKSVANAKQILELMPKKGAGLLKKVLDSAIANAEHNNAADIDELKVSTVFVNEAPRLRRFKASAKGRDSPRSAQPYPIQVAAVPWSEVIRSAFGSVSPGTFVQGYADPHVPEYTSRLRVPIPEKKLKEALSGRSLSRSGTEGAHHHSYGPAGVFVKRGRLESLRQVAALLREPE